MLSHDGAVILTSCHEYVALENSMANIHNASSSASARAIYVCTIRKETDKGSPTVLVMAKSRISPIEYLPLHRFELLGVLNEARSFQFVRKQLPLNDTGFTLWCKIRRVLSWTSGTSDERLPRLVEIIWAELIALPKSRTASYPELKVPQIWLLEVHFQQTFSNRHICCQAEMAFTYLITMIRLERLKKLTSRQILASFVTTIVICKVETLNITEKMLLVLDLVSERSCFEFVISP